MEPEGFGNIKKRFHESLKPRIEAERSSKWFKPTYPEEEIESEPSFRNTADGEDETKQQKRPGNGRG